MIKKVAYLLFSILLFASCGKESFTGKINRNCTGTYLELNNKDYLICNPSMVSSYPSGSEISVKFEFKSDVEPYAVCYMYHENHGFVRIISIND